MAIGAIVAGLQIAGGVTKAYGAYESSIQQARALREQAALNRQYAAETMRLANIEARNVERAGFEQKLGLLNRTALSRIAQEIEAGRMTGAIRARAGASGAEVGYGTPAQVEYSQRLTAKIKDYQTRAEGQRAAAAAELDAFRQAKMTRMRAAFQARQLSDRASLLTAQAKGLDRTRGMAVVGSLLGSAGSIYGTQAGLPAGERAPFLGLS